MTMQLLQQPAHRPVMGNRVRHGRDSMEPENTLLIRAHNAAPIGPLAPCILHIIVARGIGLPDINLDVLDRLALGITQITYDQQGLALGVVRHGVTGGHLLGIVGVEGA